MDISVIIPVYNKVNYIEKCFKSALSQNYDSFEVIAVDDGSTDLSGEICDRMADENPRLRVIHQRNSGVTAARRRGVEEAQGQYIMFCDSDDELLPHVLRHAIEAMKAYHADEIISLYQNQFGVLYDSDYRGQVEPAVVIKHFLFLKNCFPPIWGILFRRDIILDGCLDIPRDIYLGEDILFHIRYLTKIKSVYCIDHRGYTYYEGITSYPEINLEYERHYDQLLESSLQPVWTTIEPFFRYRQLKIYEKFIDLKIFDVYDTYYHHQLKGRLNQQIPFADRLVFTLPPRIAYYLVHSYKWWLKR